MGLCVCGSGKEASRCCMPLLEGKVRAKTVRQLMRARYAAYALGGHADFLARTWHPSTAANLGMADLNSSDYDWQSLEIVSHQQKGDIGQVEFKASYRDKGSEGPLRVHHELSLFRREKGNWYYVDGRMFEQAPE